MQLVAAVLHHEELVVLGVPVEAHYVAQAGGVARALGLALVLPIGSELPNAARRVQHRAVGNAHRALLTVFHLARVGVGSHVHVQVAGVVKHDGLALVLLAQLEARHHDFGLGGVNDFVLGVELVAVYVLVGRGVQVPVFEVHACATVIAEAAGYGGLAGGRGLQH